MKKSDFKRIQYFFTLIFLFWLVVIISEELFGYNLYRPALLLTVASHISLIVLYMSPRSEGILGYLGFMLLLGISSTIIVLFGYTTYFLVFVVTPLLLVIIVPSGTLILKSGIGGKSCKGIIPELVAGYPKAEDNYKLGITDLNKNILKKIKDLTYEGINAWFGVVDEKFIDADISAKVTQSHCVSAVECQIRDARNEKYLDPFPLAYGSNEDIFKGNYIYQEKISLDDAEKEGKKKARNKYLKKLEKIAEKKGWKGVAKLLKRINPILAAIPNIPPELVIDRVDITDISGIIHPYSLEKPVDIPTYLPDEIEDIVFRVK